MPNLEKRRNWKWHGQQRKAKRVGEEAERKIEQVLTARTAITVRRMKGLGGMARELTIMGYDGD